MSRKQLKDRRRIELIDANITCVARHGLAETTIAHVSKAADMSRGIVNFYFESKEKMMQETLQSLIGDYQAVLAEAALVAGDKATALLRVHFAQKLCNARRLGAWMAFVAHAASHNAYRKLLIESHQRAVKIFMQVGLAPEAAEEIITMIDGLWLQFSLSPEAAQRDAMSARALAVATRLKGPPKVAVVAKKPAKPTAKPASDLPQLDFGDLFAKNA